jgi:hypothetical protein
MSKNLSYFIEKARTGKHEVMNVYFDYQRSLLKAEESKLQKAEDLKREKRRKETEEFKHFSAMINQAKIFVDDDDYEVIYN